MYGKKILVVFVGGYECNAQHGEDHTKEEREGFLEV